MRQFKLRSPDDDPPVDDPTGPGDADEPKPPDK